MLPVLSSLVKYVKIRTVSIIGALFKILAFGFKQKVHVMLVANMDDVYFKTK